MESTRPHDEAEPFQLFMLGLSVYVLAALAARTFFELSAATVQILAIADFGISFLFLLDFVHSLARAKDRTRYMLTWGWLDLLSSIPTIETMRWARGARVVRILRVLRGLKAARVISTFAVQKRGECAVWTAILVAILAIVFSSIAILHLEPAQAPINTAEEALWWSVVTATTVGYGDLYPVGGPGRLVAVGLMLVGIGLFGTLTAFVAASFLEPQEESQDTQLAAIQKELARLNLALERLNRNEELSVKEPEKEKQTER